MTITAPGGLGVKDLVLGYKRPLHDPLNFTVHAGEILAVLGPSGCGKSTLLSTIAGVIPPLGGQVFLNGHDLANTPIHERRIGLVFQQPLLFGHLSLIDNIAYGLRAQNIDKPIARERAALLLDWVGLTSVKDQRPWELSGGQAGRVALARALAPEPQALLLDEPYSALDTDTRLRIAQEVAELIREKGVPAIHVTHDKQEAESIATNTLLLQ